MKNEECKWVILDRDGVINQESKAYIKSPEEWIPETKSLEAIALLTKANFQIAIATNQSGIARGFYSLETLQAIHDKMLKAIQQIGGEIAGIFYCPHHPSEQCLCRKPEPGLLLQISQRFQFSLAQVPIIGDSYRDLQAAWQVGAEAILVQTGNGQETLQQHPQLVHQIKVFANLYEAAEYLISLFRTS